MQRYSLRECPNINIYIFIKGESVRTRVDCSYIFVKCKSVRARVDFEYCTYFLTTTPDIFAECFVTNRTTIAKAKRVMTTASIRACCIFLVIDFSCLNQGKSNQLGTEVHFTAALKQQQYKSSKGR